MRNVSSQRFQHATTLLSECYDLIRAIHDGKPVPALSQEELEAAGKLADLCHSITWTLCDNASLSMDDELNPNELMVNLWMPREAG